jgi:succinate dehydrogenase / fumarate reductase, membrane anchor subunit
MSANPINPMRTPLKNVRHLGSAKEGANHFVLQRLTAVANVVLGLFLVWLIASLAGADHAAVKSALRNPFIGLALLLLILSGTVHMRLGMQVIIEDYVRSEGMKLAALALNTFFAILIGVASVFAIMKLTLGA